MNYFVCYSVSKIAALMFLNGNLSKSVKFEKFTRLTRKISESGNKRQQQ